MGKTKDVKEMTGEQMEERIARLAFDGDLLKFREFCAKLKAGVPEGVGIALRGSVVTSKRWEDGEPFDADGRGSSDIDVTLIGSKAMQFWNDDAYYIPAMHTKPLCDADPGVAPGIDPLRRELQKFAGRPVNMQATANFILFTRDILFDEPYYTLVEAQEGS